MNKRNTQLHVALLAGVVALAAACGGPQQQDSAAGGLAGAETAYLYSIVVERIQIGETGDVGWWFPQGEVYAEVSFDGAGWVPLFNPSVWAFGMDDGVAYSVEPHQRNLIHVPPSAVGPDTLSLGLGIYDLEAYPDTLYATPARAPIEIGLRGRDSWTQDLALEGPDANPVALTLRVVREAVDADALDARARVAHCDNVMSAVEYRIHHTALESFGNMEDKKVIQAQQENYAKLAGVRDALLSCPSATSCDATRRLFNQRVLGVAGETLTGTDWINEEFSALPNASALVLDPAVCQAR